MTLDPVILPGLLLLALQLLALATLGYVVARVALRQSDDLQALAQGMVIGPALWGLAVNFVLHALPGFAGAAATWIGLLGLSVGLAWRSPGLLRIPARTAAGFAAVGLATFWVVLAARQMLAIPDDINHLTLAAQFRAGGWPPEFAWNPGVPAAYHHGLDLLVGLLAPPSGPDLALTTEVVSAWIWTSLALVIGSMLRAIGGWLAAAVLAPLLLSNGSWTLVLDKPPGIVQVPVPTGVPSAGIRSTLSEVFWPSVELPWSFVESVASPPNVWKPLFVLAYALAVLVLRRAAQREPNTWPSVLTLAALLGFQGLVDETLALLTLVVWGGLEAWRYLRDGCGDWSERRRGLLLAFSGPVLGALLLAGGGGVITSALTSSAGSGLSLGWNEDPASRNSLVGADARAGGLGLLWFGPLPVLGLAVLLNRRSRLVVALAVGSFVSLVGLFVLQYEHGQHDIVRFDGHARNFALLALLPATAYRLSSLAPRWRHLAAVAGILLVVWPTIAEPVQNLRVSLTRRPQLANAQVETEKFHNPYLNRTVIGNPLSAEVASYIRHHTEVDARILSATPNDLSIATGRPNASGLIRSLQFLYFEGPEYQDAIQDLDPGAVGRLGVTYVHAPDDWVEGLPERTQARLRNPDLFRLLVRGGDDALYRVRPAFLELPSEPGTYEALRRAIPESASVYLAPSSEPLSWVRAASALSHTRLFGTLKTHISMHYRSDFQPDPLEGGATDLVVLPLRGIAPSAFAPDRRQPIWWNDELAVYAPTGTVAPVAMPPPREPFRVNVSSVRAATGRVSFTATFINEAGETWEGQDWLVTAVDASPWEFPNEFEDDARHEGVQWYAGQLIPRQATATYTYDFDPRERRLAVVDASGAVTQVASSGDALGAGTWALGVRLRHDWYEAAFVPVMTITVSKSGEVTYQAYEGTLGVRLTR
ncbi:MAG: hypothetical protein OXG17_05965 [Chloroflexi bacterium]|nr:hypothetical protein [Chloroflexota bacterium]